MRSKAINWDMSGRFGVLVCALLFSNPVIAGEADKPPGGVLKYEEPKYLKGSIYSIGKEDKKLLFNFSRVGKRSGTTLKVDRYFTNPNGSIAAREHILYEGDALVSYELQELQAGAFGSAKIQRSTAVPGEGNIAFEYREEAGSKPRTRTEGLVENALTGDMVGPFLIEHWDQLQRGAKVKCRYLVVPRKETIGFTFIKQSDSRWNERDAVIVKMEVTSPLLAPLVDPLFFTIEKAPPHRVLQYVGRTTPKIQVGKKWKDLDATTVFDWESAR